MKPVMLASLVFFFGLEINFVDAQQTASPGSVADAKAVFDLSQKPLVEAVERPVLNVALQQFEAKGTPETVAKAIDAELVRRGMAQQPGAMFTEAYSAATYQKGGFTFSLGVMPSGKDGIAAVTLTNLGNVNFKTLPKVQDAKEVFVQGSSAIYSSKLSLDDARSKSRELLETAGWEWFGDTAASFFMRKDAVRLQVMCNSAPDGNTMLMFSSEQMSTALPLLSGLKRIAYTEPQSRLEGDSPMDLANFWSEYRKLLESKGWKATTDNPLEATVGKYLIFRNPAGELLELKAHTFEDASRFELSFMTAEQVKEEDKQAREAVEKAKAKQSDK